MEVSTIDCLSCLEDKNVFNIFDTHECEGKEEIYVDMLKSCFDITISEDSGIKGMCEKCILKLRDAYYFKMDVIKNVDVLTNQASIQLQYLDDEVSSHGDDDDVELQVDPETGKMAMLYTVVDNKKLIKIEQQIETLKNNNKNYKTNFGNGTRKENVPMEHGVKLHEMRIEKYKKCNENSLKKNRGTEDGSMESNIRNEEDNGSAKCQQCAKIFPTAKQLNKHMMTHKDGPHTCQYCGMEFSKLNTKYAHVWRVHHTKEPYICGQCGERFTTFHKRMNHLQQVHGEIGEYACPYCDKKFKYITPRSKHIRSIHLNVRNHKCTECNMAFFKRGALRCHMASIHDIGEKPYVCPTCGKAFCKGTTLKFHMKRHEENIHYRIVKVDDL